MDSIQTNLKSGSLGQKLSTPPLSLLAWLEMRALKMEYAAYVRQAAVDDAWYVHFEGATEGPQRFEDVLQRLIDGQSHLAILHASAVDEDAPSWRFLSYRSWSLNPVTSSLWIVSFWVLALLFGWVLVCLLLPSPVRGLREGVYGLGLLALAGAMFSPKMRMPFSRWQKPKQHTPPEDEGEPVEAQRPDEWSS